MSSFRVVIFCCISALTAAASLRANATAARLANAKRVDEHNARFDAGLESFKLGLNEFADFTPDEWKQIYLPRHIATTLARREGDAAQPASISVPSEVDWRKEGVVGPVQNLGQCDVRMVCWYDMCDT